MRVARAYWDRMTGAARTVPLIVFAAAFLLMAAIPSAHADLYTVSGVRTDVTDENALLAREKALAEGQKQALTELMKRLSDPSDWGKIPTLGEEFDINRYVRSFQVRDERTTPTRYRADLVKVRFVPKAVEQLMRSKGLKPFTQAAPRAALLAVMDTPDGPILWEDNNPWRQGLEQVDFTDTLTPMTLPLGDVFDVSSITAEQALSQDLLALRKFAERQGVEDVVVAYAVPQTQGQGVDISMTRYPDIGKAEDKLRANWQNPNADSTGHVKDGTEKNDANGQKEAGGATASGQNSPDQADVAGALPGAVDVRGEDGTPVEPATTDLEAAARKQMELLRSMMPPPATVTFNVMPSTDDIPLYRWAGENLRSESETWWKRYDAPGRKLKTYALQVDVPFTSYWEWRDIRKKLINNKTLTGSNLQAISPAGAVVTLYYTRQRDVMAKSLEAQNLYLAQKWGRWELKDRLSAPALEEAPAAVPTSDPSATPQKPSGGTPSQGSANQQDAALYPLEEEPRLAEIDSVNAEAAGHLRRGLSPAAPALNVPPING